MTDYVLQVDDLTMHYSTRAGEVSAVNNVTFSLERGQAMGLVGESGCGKTSVACSLLKLLPDNAYIKTGSIKLNETDIVPLSEEEMRTGVHAAVQRQLFIPLFVTAAETNVGGARLMDFIAKYAIIFSVSERE